MDCRKLQRHLDEQGPDFRESDLLEHVAQCPACSAAVRAFWETEAALGEAGQAARSVYASVGVRHDFADRVLARIETAQQRLSAQARGEAGRLRWVTLAADPFVSVTITLALLLASIAALYPGWARVLMDWGVLWLGRYAIAMASQARETPYLWQAVAAALAPASVWIAWTFVRLLRRALILRVTARAYSSDPPKSRCHISGA